MPRKGPIYSLRGARKSLAADGADLRDRLSDAGMMGMVPAPSWDRIDCDRRKEDICAE